jgi:EmrB/QacA subfamily drug resistance transporter
VVGPALPGTDIKPTKSTLLLAVVALGTMMVALDGTIVLIAQPAIQRSLDASLQQAQWVTTAYLLAVGTFLVIAGGFGDRIGNRRAFLIGVTGFTLTSGLIAGVGDIWWLIGLRVVQGLFGAILQPTTLGLLRETFPGERLDMPIAIRSAAIGVSTAAGPVVGGLLVQHVSWRAAFLINVPLGLLTVLLGAIVLRRRPAPGLRPAAEGRFDMAGAALLAAFLFAVFFSVGKITVYGVLNLRSVALVGAVITLAMLFTLREARAHAPLVPLTLFRSSNLVVGIFLVISFSFAMMGTLFITSYYVQNKLGLDPVQSGIHVLPLTATMIVAAPLSGYFMRYCGARTIVSAGLALTAGAVFGLSRLGQTVSPTRLSLLLLVLGLGIAPALVGTTKIIVSNAPPSVGSLAGGLHQTGMQVGSAIGIAVMGTMLSDRADQLLEATLARAADGHVNQGFLTQALTDVAAGRHHPIPHTPPGLVKTWSALSESIFMHAFSYALLAGVVMALTGAVVALVGVSSKRPLH